MAGLTGTLNEALAQVLVEQGVTLVGKKRPAIADDPDSAIVSGLPFVRVDAGRGSFGGRRKRLTLRRGSRHATFLVRTRRLPPEPECGWLVVGRARARAGRLLPVCAVDQREGLIHVLLDLETATVVEASEGIDPAGLLAEAFIGEPLTVLLDLAPPPRVGEAVIRRVRSLLQKRPLDERHAVENELSVLRRFAPESGLPRVLARRLERLARALGERRDEVTEERVAREVARLVKLVESRALAAIRVGPTRIEGLINPGAMGHDWRYRAVMFRLQLGSTPFHPILQTWSPQRPAPRRGHGHCLGEAQPVLHELDAGGDIYSLIDTVINFRETNHILALPVVEPSWLGRRLVDWVAPML